MDIRRRSGGETAQPNGIVEVTIEAPGAVVSNGEALRVVTVREKDGEVVAGVIEGAAFAADEGASGTFEIDRF